MLFLRQNIPDLKVQKNTLLLLKIVQDKIIFHQYDQFGIESQPTSPGRRGEGVETEKVRIKRELQDLPGQPSE